LSSNPANKNVFEGKSNDEIASMLRVPQGVQYDFVVEKGAP
jgi:transposase